VSTRAASPVLRAVLVTSTAQFQQMGWNTIMASIQVTTSAALRPLRWLWLGTALAAANLVSAQAGPSAGSSAAGDTQQAHRGPPPEALQACSTKKMDDPCSFSGPRGNMEGTCWAPQGLPLACRPKDHREPPPGQK